MLLLLEHLVIDSHHSLHVPFYVVLWVLSQFAFDNLFLLFLVLIGNSVFKLFGFYARFHILEPLHLEWGF